MENGILFGSHFHLSSCFRGHSGANEQKCQTIGETGLKVLFLAQGLKPKNLSMIDCIKRIGIK